jgi:hypothetical protein
MLYVLIILAMKILLLVGQRFLTNSTMHITNVPAMVERLGWVLSSLKKPARRFVIIPIVNGRKIPMGGNVNLALPMI